MKKKSSQRQSTGVPGKAPISVAVAWYTEPEWLKIKASAVDQDDFFEFHAQWVEMAEGKLQKLREAGCAPVKIPVAAEELFAFCRAEKLKNDGHGRAAFATKRKAEIELLGGGKGWVC